MSERNFDDFDGFATDYRKIHSENIKLSGADSLYFAEHKILELTNFENNLPLKMLDVGCGDGAVELFVQQYFSTWQVQGIDVSDKSIEAAAKKNIPNTIFTLYNGTTIPFADNTFDIVFIAAVLHHIHFSFHAAFIAEIKRVLKKGGRLYIFEHNPLNPVTRYIVKTCVFDKDAKLLPIGYGQKLLRAAAFNSVQKKFLLFFPRKGILSKCIKFEKMLSVLPFGAQYLLRAIK